MLGLYCHQLLCCCRIVRDVLLAAVVFARAGLRDGAEAGVGICLPVRGVRTLVAVDAPAELIPDNALVGCVLP